MHRFHRAIVGLVALIVAVLGLPSAGALQDDATIPAFDEDVAVLGGPGAVTRATEGSALKVDVYLRRPAPVDVTVVLELLFAGPDVEGAASPRDLANDGSIVMSPNGNRFFVEVPIAVGNQSAPVEILTAEDNIRNEGIERFRLRIVEVRGAPGGLTFSDDLELEIEDGTPARTPAFSVAAPPPTPTPDPIIGPIVAGRVDYAIEDRTVTLTLPAALRVWLSPAAPVRVLSGDNVVTSVSGTPATIVLELPDDASPPIVLTLQSRLRSGAEYREVITLERPADECRSRSVTESSARASRGTPQRPRPCSLE